MGFWPPHQEHRFGFLFGPGRMFVCQDPCSAMCKVPPITSPPGVPAGSSVKPGKPGLLSVAADEMVAQHAAS